MNAFEPQDPDYLARIRSSFGRQVMMQTLAAELTRIEPGLVEIEMPYDERFTQQHGYLHAGVTTAIADSAGGYAGYTLMPADSSILAVEFKVNLLTPARGTRFRARGQVVKSGRRLTITEIQVEALEEARTTLCLRGLQTSITLHGESDAPD